MQCLASHPQAPGVLRDICASLHGAWSHAAAADGQGKRPLCTEMAHGAQIAFQPVARRAAHRRGRRVALHAVVGAAVLTYEPARSALLAAAPIMVSLITPPRPGCEAAGRSRRSRSRSIKPQPKPPEPQPIIAAPVEAPSPSPILVAPPPPPPEPAPVAAAPAPVDHRADLRRGLSRQPAAGATRCCRAASASRDASCCACWSTPTGGADDVRDPQLERPLPARRGGARHGAPLALRSGEARRRAGAGVGADPDFFQTGRLGDADRRSASPISSPRPTRSAARCSYSCC